MPTVDSECPHRPSQEARGVSMCGASVGFLTRYERELREPLVWRQGEHGGVTLAPSPGSLPAQRLS